MQQPRYQQVDLLDLSLLSSLYRQKANPTHNSSFTHLQAVKYHGTFWWTLNNNLLFSRFWICCMCAVIVAASTHWCFIAFKYRIMLLNTILFKSLGERRHGERRKFHVSAIQLTRLRESTVSLLYHTNWHTTQTVCYCWHLGSIDVTSVLI